MIFLLESGLPGGYGVALLQTLFALAAVSILAWIVLRWTARRGLGLGAKRRVKVLERVPLDGRRTLYLVEVGDKVLLIGVGDAAPPAVLREFDPRELPELEAEPSSFGELVAKLRGKPDQG